MPDRHLWTRHSTQTIAFDGTAGAGLETSDVTVFSITGRVWVHAIAAFCTEDLVSAGGGTLSLGEATDVDAFIASTTATAIDANEWWLSATPAAGSLSLATGAVGASTAQVNKVLSADIIITIGTADITDGTIVFDVLYTPLTDGARLS